MPSLTSVQTGSVSYTSTETGDKTATVTSVTTARSVLFFTHSAGNAYDNMDSMHAVRGILTNATTITFNRHAASSDPLEIRWTLVEFASGALDADVIHGTISVDADPEDVTISSRAAAQSMYAFSHKCATNWIARSPVVYQTSSTNLRIDSSVTPTSGECDVAYFVVTFKAADAVAQSGQHTWVATDTSEAITITSVDTSQAFAYGATTPAYAPCRDWTRFRLTAATTLTLDRFQAGSGSAPVAGWHVLEMLDSSVVQSWTVSMTSGETSPATQPSWGTAMTNGVVFSHNNWTHVKSTSDSATIQHLKARITLDAPQDSVTYTRGVSGYAVDYAGTAIDWLGAAAGAFFPPWMRNTQRNTRSRTFLRR